MDSDFAPCKLIEYKDGMFGLLLSNFEPAYVVFDGMGKFFNGHTLQHIVQSQVRLKMPERANALHYDSEADMFVVRSTDREALKAAAGLIRELMNDSETLRQAMEVAGPD